MSHEKSIVDEVEHLSPEARQWLEESMRYRQPDEEAQKAFLGMLTTQRIANLTGMVDAWSEMAPETKEWLRKADKAKIDQLNSTIEFMNASRIIWRFLWVGGGMALGAFVGFTTFWKTIGEWVTVKIK